VYDARPVPPRARASVPVVSEIAMPSDDVASAVTFPAAPVTFARIELAAICASFVRATPLVASESVPFAPPTSAPRVPEYENSALVASDVVAAAYEAPLLAATRPEKVLRVGAFVKVWVPAQVFDVVVASALLITFDAISSGYVAEVMRFVYAVFQLDDEVMRLSAKVPIQYGVKVWAFALEMIVIPRFVSAVEVASVWVPPVCPVE